MHSAFELQDFIFESKARRLDLMGYKPKHIGKIFNIFVYRNHSFELIENTIRPFLDYAQIDINFHYSDYDDSLSFFDLDPSVDLVLLWLDLSRYELGDARDFIKERVDALRNIFQKNIVLAPYGGDCQIADNQVVTYSLVDWEKRLGEKYLDLRMEAFSGTKLSTETSLCVSRDLGLNWFPALLQPNLKCVVVDLDNTLYRGVLGEDGVNGVVLTENHKKLQEKLVKLYHDGFFLCVASKNDERDVVRLFEERNDFPLELEHFSKICAHWESKANSIAEIAQSLNIHPNSFVFVDDNIGELISVSNAHPEIKSIWAKDDASITYDCLSNFPGLLKLQAQVEDRLRSHDVKASVRRKELMEQASIDEYIKMLEMKLTFSVNDTNQISRITELGKKTNQFIFNYKRYSSADVSEQMLAPDCAVVSISLKDKLSDSGIIGAIFCRKGDHVTLEECFVSCRALGRGIDTAIVLGALNIATQKLGDQKLEIMFQEGERNLPAKKFMAEHLADYYGTTANFSYEINSSLIIAR
jgi:FkbH-like protein